MNNQQNIQELVNHKTKLANAALRSGLISTVATITVLLCLMSNNIGSLFKDFFSTIVLLSFGSGIVALYSGIASKCVNRKLPNDEAIHEQDKTKAEFGILLGLLNLLPMGFITFFVMFSLSMGMAIFNG